MLYNLQQQPSNATTTTTSSSIKSVHWDNVTAADHVAIGGIEQGGGHHQHTKHRVVSDDEDDVTLYEHHHHDGDGYRNHQHSNLMLYPYYYVFMSVLCPLSCLIINNHWPYYIPSSINLDAVPAGIPNDNDGGDGVGTASVTSYDHYDVGDPTTSTTRTPLPPSILLPISSVNTDIDIDTVFVGDASTSATTWMVERQYLR